MASFGSSVKIDGLEAMRLAAAQDYVEFGVLFAEAFIEAMQETRDKMERAKYHPDKSQLPHLSITFVSTGVPDGD